VPGQRPTYEGYQAQQAEYGRAEDRREVGRRKHYGMAATLMILSGLLSCFIGSVALVRGIFFNTVSTYPFYYSTRSRGVTLLVIGVVLLLVGLALLVRMHWARTVGIVVAVISAIANFMFLPFYPFWSVIVLAIDIIIIWELARDDRPRREFVLASSRSLRAVLRRDPAGLAGYPAAGAQAALTSVAALSGGEAAEGAKEVDLPEGRPVGFAEVKLGVGALPAGSLTAASRRWCG
jgi:hypothetical protein